ncbi:MAG: HlyD family type I secretion periplasmic adaptor subunit [Sulfuricurvum sp.]|uniref:HlyD family type I secretion periplasmic adaptor subunit n=1 Tax=Sulfuricurvum sp. TaxID=2025608 RepID=UPI0026044E17|nr:HlyD family type I secretion periplasmic adaptor subunit [Sulfuricurvum sp.]MDD2828994.1 HlyD family type I secretion periplasmic adaptor subunit [Sulfuricurvum sp.]MDD4950093.1 HlyD family type I secretion periplasmic adaptor subunit [Sulfuricurvum sp.]
MTPKKKYNFDANDYQFMRSLSAAVLEDTPHRLRSVLIFWLITVFIFFLWAALAPIDELVRGEGKVIPGGENQMIQHLEGGMLSAILVKEGQRVKSNDVLLKVDNLKSSSTYESSQYKSAELRARIVRLRAESTGGPFSPSDKDMQEIPMQIMQERSLFASNKDKLQSQLDSLQDLYQQKQGELSEAQGHINEQKHALELIKEEVAISEPMVAQGIKPRVEFLKLQREYSDVNERYNSVRASIPRLRSAINEISSKMREARSEYVTKARIDLNAAVTENQRVGAESSALADQVTRTVIKSPINGIVQKIFVNTVGGVIKPGDNLIEIVPTEGGLLIEAKVKPSDIAFIYPGQKAVVKVTAYDFSIYGSLNGVVSTISPDTETDQKQNVYYIVRVQTNKKYLGTKEKPLKIIPGMMVNVDVITGQKTVLEYILKPLLKAKQYTFSER